MSEHPPTDETAEDTTVSVIIPFCETYTPRELLEKAIDSVESQVGVETEVIVVEDDDERGPAWARNVGLDRAETRYVAFLDGDDVWDETKLVEQLGEMEATGAGMCVDGERDYSPIEFVEALLAGETFGLTSSIVLDTEQTDVRFDETLPRREDHLFMIEVAMDAGVCFSSDTFFARKYEDGLSKHVDTSRDQIDRFFETVTERVPEAERFERLYYQNAYVYLGRSRHDEREYWTALRHFGESLRYGPNILAVGATGLTILAATYDVLSRPVRRLTGRGIHE